MKGFVLCDFKTNAKAKEISVVLVKERFHTAQSKGIQYPEMDLYKCNQMLFDKSTDTIQ